MDENVKQIIVDLRAEAERRHLTAPDVYRMLDGHPDVPSLQTVRRVLEGDLSKANFKYTTSIKPVEDVLNQSRLEDVTQMIKYVGDLKAKIDFLYDFLLSKK